MIIFENTKSIENIQHFKSLKNIALNIKFSLFLIKDIDQQKLIYLIHLSFIIKIRGSSNILNIITNEQVIVS